MKVDIYWIPACQFGRLGIMARPRAGDWLADEIQGWGQEEVDVVVSLLTTLEVWELGLEQEEEMCKNAGIQFITYPIFDRQVPRSQSATKQFIYTLYNELQQGKHIAIHLSYGGGAISPDSRLFAGQTRFVC